MERIERHSHAIGHRCDTVVEPRLSDQWFVRMKPLAEPALAAWRDGRVRFIPEHRGLEYAQWMEGIRDWCISRQLWWGHRIPVWYCESAECGEVSASLTDRLCPGCGGRCARTRMCSTPGSPLAGAVLGTSAGPTGPRTWPGSTRAHPGHRPRDPVLLGRPDDHGRDRVHGRGALLHRVSPRHGARHAAPEDVQVAGQRDRSRRGAALAPTRCATPWCRAFRSAPTWCSIPTTSRAPSPRGATSPTSSGTSAASFWAISTAGPPAGENSPGVVLGDPGGPLDHRPLRGDGAGGHRGIRALPAQRCRARAAPLHLERSGGLVRGGDQAAALWRSAGRRCRPRRGDPDLRRGAPPRSTRSCPSSPSDSGDGFPAGPSPIRSWWRPGRQRPPRPDAAAMRGFGALQELVAAVRSIRSEYGVEPGQTVRVTVPAGSRGLGGAGRGRGDGAAAGQGGGAGHGGAWRGRSHRLRQRGAGRRHQVSIPLGDLVDLERECARLEAESRRLAGAIRSQESKLDNPQFVSRAPAEVWRGSGRSSPPGRSRPAPWPNAGGRWDAWVSP